MNMITRIAALGAALCTFGTVMTGCGGSEKYTEQYDVISQSSEKALAVAKAEMEINENVTVDEDIVGVLENGSSYTYIQYEMGEDPTYRIESNNGTDEYALFNGEMGAFEYKDGDLKAYTGEAPDFSKYIDLDFALEDVKMIEVTYGDKGTKLYTVTMNASYADKFDADKDGGRYDCTAVVYVYKIDSLIRLKSVETKYTAQFTYNGKTVNTVKTESVNFSEMTVQ